MRSTYREDEIDAVAVYCGKLDKCYLLPAAMAVGRWDLWLRVRPALNGQKACITLAEDVEFAGAVAQLEERWRGTPEATGSSPVSSTSTDVALVAVGAHQFRNHFGYHMQRAAGGDRILVTRRGRPSILMTAADPQAIRPELAAPASAELKRGAA